MVVFNRSNRLRVFGVDTHGNVSEKVVAGASETTPGFSLIHGRAVQVSAAMRADGQFTIFLATPAVSGIVTAVYAPDTMTLQTTSTEDTAIATPISRSVSASPYIGGRVLSVSSPSTNSTGTYYLSTDRNGSLTWINTDDFTFGFLDLVSSIPDASRDPEAANYRDPHDNLIDPIQILSLIHI